MALGGEVGGAEMVPGVAGWMGGDCLRGSCHDDLSSLIPGVGAEIDHPVDLADDVEIVFDHDDRVTLVDHALEDE